MILAAATMVAQVSAGVGESSFFPLREPKVQDYFKPLKGFEGKFYEQGADFVAKHEIVRMNNMTKDQFFDLIRRGQPFLVEDCAEGHPYTDWPCSKFGDKWPKGHMKSEYTATQEHILLGAKGPDAWHQKKRDGDTQPQHLSNGSMLSGPYVWHVKDEVPEWMKKDVQKNWKPPYFLKDTAVNRLEAWDSFEFWFSMPDGGTFAHADSYCEMAISTQLRGTKRWRLGMYPQIPTIFDSFVSTDRGIYRAKGKWQPEYDFKVKAGQCFIFPPGYIHETHMDPIENDECSVATTFQYNIPFPVKYIRNFLPRLFNSHLVWEEKCNHRWESFFTFTDAEDDENKVSNNPLMKASEIEKRVRRIFDRVDTSKDDILQREEIQAYFADAKFLRRKAHMYSWSQKVTKEDLKQVESELIESHVDDTIGYNDVDEDGTVTFEELYNSTYQYHILAYRKKTLMGLDDSNPKMVVKAKKIEYAFNKKFRCGDSEDTKTSEHCQYNSTYFNKFRISKLARLPLYDVEPQDTELGDRLASETDRLEGKDEEEDDDDRGSGGGGGDDEL